MKIEFLIVCFFISLAVFSQEKETGSALKTEYSYQYALIEASRQKMIGNIDEAVNLYESCIKANPECDVAYYELGTVYSAMGEASKSEDNLAIAYKLNPKNYWYGIAYSELLKQNKNNGKSLKVLKKIRKINKSNSLTIDFKIAEIYTEQGKFNKALNYLDGIEKENGVSEMISFKKIEIYKSQKKFHEAEVVLNELTAKSPDEVEYQIYRAELFMEQGDSLNALRAYEKAYRIDSSNIYAVTNLADMYSAMGDDPKAYFFLNQAFANKNIPLSSKIQTMIYLNKDRGLIKEQRPYVEEMINTLNVQYPDNYDVSTVSYDFYNGLDDHQKSIVIIKKMLSQKKDDFILWQQALYTASMLENYDELISIGEEALKYFPNKNEIYLFVGMAYFQKEKYEESYSVLNQAFLSIKSDDKIRVQYLIFLAESAYKSDHKKEAYLFYDQLIAAEPENDLTKNNYSYYLALDSIDLLKAKELSYSTILHAPDNSTFIDTYAWILFKLGEYSSARVYSEKALVLNAEKDPDIVFHYAEILFALNENVLSEKYYKLALERGYDEDIIYKKLESISIKK
jgi:tetratricopeptide (TPR) repeat protein